MVSVLLCSPVVPITNGYTTTFITMGVTTIQSMLRRVATGSMLAAPTTSLIQITFGRIRGGVSTSMLAPPTTTSCVTITSTITSMWGYSLAPVPAALHTTTSLFGV